MIKNYLKTAFRNLLKHKVYAIINIIGLALGIACCILILLWVQNEFEYDQFHNNNERLYLLTGKFENGYSPSSPWALLPTLKNYHPEIEKGSRFYEQQSLVKCGTKRGYESIAYVDNDFLEMFTFPMKKGNPSNALSSKESVVISEKIALKFFGTKDPIGKTIEVNHNMKLMVTGVVENVKKNSSLKFDLLVPIKNLGDDRLATWSSESLAYILLKKNTNVENFEDKIAKTTQTYDTRTTNKTVINCIFKFNRLYLYGINQIGAIIYVYIFIAISFIVLLVACINFVNLITAKSSIRGKEIGMRKVSGASRIEIILQFYCETLLLTLISLFFAYALVIIFLPKFNVLAGTEIKLDFFKNPVLSIGSFFIVAITTIFAGSYPAFLMSAFQPITALKHSTNQKVSKFSLRWILVIIQFSASMILISMTLVMNQQVNYIQNKKLGFNKEQVIKVDINKELQSSFNAIKNRLLQNPNITHVSEATNNPNAIYFRNPVYWEGRGPDRYERMNYIVIDYDFLETFEIELLSGRNFSRNLASDKYNYIINEKAAEYMQMDYPVGNMFSIWENEGQIIGVVKNFHSMSLHNEITPVVMTLLQFMPPDRMFIRINPQNIKESLNAINDIWNEYMPNFPFQYQFMDEIFNNQYQYDKKIIKIFQFFSGFAIFISCIGLFGLSTFIAQSRTKEIGVRKVVGAKVYQIIFIMLLDIIKWLILSIIIATPISIYLINKWLQNFAYRIDLTIWSFFMSGLAVLVIAMLTVSWQAVQAARANPIKSLKYE